MEGGCCGKQRFKDAFNPKCDGAADGLGLAPISDRKPINTQHLYGTHL
jgi:hypothetical protein